LFTWAIKIIGGLVILTVVLALGGYFFLFARPHPSDPLDVQVSFEDLQAFVSAHEIAQTSDRAVDIYASNYFSRETAPIETYVSMLGISAEWTAADARDRPKFYENLTNRIHEIVATESAIRSAVAKFERRYSDAVFPPVYVLFGAFKARAMIRPFGILIGAEYFTAEESIIDFEDPNSLFGLMNRPAAITSQVVHELAHIQQARKHPVAYMSNGSVLNWAIYEGTADFIAFSITGAHSNEAAHAYLAGNEEVLWCAFAESTDADGRSHWLNDYLLSRPPSGISGAFGYQIAKAFFERSKDSDEAFSLLVELGDYEIIFERSGYKEHLAKLCG